MGFGGATPPWGTSFSLWGVTIFPGMGGPLWGNDEAGAAGIFRQGPDSGGVDTWTVTTDAGSYRSSGVDFNPATAGLGGFLVRPLPIPEPSTAL